MTLNISELKKNQRKKYSKKRFILSRSVKFHSDIFYKTLHKHSWFKESKVIASFISIKTEISTLYLNKDIIGSGKILCFPVIEDNINDVLVFKRFLSQKNLVIGKYGIKEPLNTSIYLPEIIITPCLAFDNQGFRLGYGGGYYDKTISYFNSINHNFITIGLAYDQQKV